MSSVNMIKPWSERIRTLKVLEYAEAYGALVPTHLLSDPCDDWTEAGRRLPWTNPKKPPKEGPKVLTEKQEK